MTLFLSLLAIYILGVFVTFTICAYCFAGNSKTINRIPIGEHSFLEEVAEDNCALIALIWPGLLVFLPIWYAIYGMGCLVERYKNFLIRLREKNHD